MYTYTYICNLAHFGSAFVFTSPELGESRPFFRFLCASTIASALGVGMQQMFPWGEHLLVLSQVSGVTAGQFFSTHKTCEHQECFTSSSLDAVIATSEACCRLSATSLLCDLPDLCLNTASESFLGMGRAL